MTVDEFRQSDRYIPEAEPVLAELYAKYGEFTISPPVILVEGGRLVCKCLIPWNGHLRLTKDVIPVKQDIV